jgi:phasin
LTLRIGNMADITFRRQEMSVMTANTAGVKAKTAKPFRSEGSSKLDRPKTDATGAVREVTQQNAASTKDIYKKTEAAAEETNRAFEWTYSTVAKGAADFNLQWIEMARANTNSAFDFACRLVAVKSPSEFLELSAAHAREQFETFIEQIQHLTALAQKVTTDAVQPLQAGVTSAFSRAA